MKITNENLSFSKLNRLMEKTLNESLYRGYSTGKACSCFCASKNKVEIAKGIYVNKEIFSFGNHKLDDSIATFSLSAILTCANCKSCKNSCYAMKSQKQYYDTFNKRLILTYLAKNHLDKLEELICNAIEKFPKKINCVRIHEAGDFISQEYVNMWVRIASRFPQYNFYYYTKVNKIYNLSFLANLKNVKENKSCIEIDGKIYKNYGSIKYLTKLKKLCDKHNIKMFICGYGTENEKACGKECKCCMACKDVFVCFIQH